MKNQFSLLADRRFWPFFIVQAGGAFNDNLMKTAVVVLIAYGLWDVDGMNPATLVSLAAALFILPFIVFCPLAGELADKYSKNAIIRAVKIAEIGIVMLAIPALFYQSLPLAMLALVGLGTHSAFFSPTKFAILPQHLMEDELIAANGLVGSGTYVAILAGTIAGAALAPMAGGIAIISVILLVCAGGGLAASFLIPPAPPPLPDLKLSFNPARNIAGALRCAFSQKPGVAAAMIGVAWFYFVASAFHSQFPNFTGQVLKVDTAVLTLFMIVFSLGIGVGGMLNNRLLKGRVEAWFVPFAILGVGVFSLDLCLASMGFEHSGEMMMGLEAFMTSPAGLRILFDLLGLSLCGGLYVIPLRAIVQHRARAEEKARVVAAGSMIDSVMMLLSSVLAMVMFGFGFTLLHLFALIGLACLVVSVYFRMQRSLKPL